MRCADAAVRALLDVLTQGERIAVSRTVFYGLTLEEGAAELGVTTGAFTSCAQAD